MILPHHRLWSVRRSVDRRARFFRDQTLGKRRGRSDAYLTAQAHHYELGASLPSMAGPVDICCVNFAPGPTGAPSAECAFRCLGCGGSLDVVPDDYDNRDRLKCPACGISLGMKGDILRFAMWLTVDEQRYGDPARRRMPAEYLGEGRKIGHESDQRVPGR